MFCPKCGKQNPDDALFCSECGASFPKTVSAPEPQNDSYNPGSGYNSGSGYAGGNSGYNPKGGYNPNRGYNPNNGYNPNGGYKPQTGSAGSEDIPPVIRKDNEKKKDSGKIPVIIICVICAVLIAGIVIFTVTKLTSGKKGDTAEVETTTEAQTEEETTEAETTKEETTTAEEKTIEAETIKAETTKADPKVTGYGTWIVNCSSNDAVSLRKSPDIKEDTTHSLKIQGQVQVQVLDVDCEGFFKVSVGGEEGYILGSYLDPTSDAIDIESTQTLTATEGDIHLLDIPHVNGTAEYLATISQGEKVNVFCTTRADDDNKTYYFVEYNGIRGYVVTAYQGRTLFK